MHSYTTGMTAAQFRKLALAQPGAVEGEHMNHPDFRIGGKIFASLGAPDDAWGMVKLTPEEQKAFIKQAPATFSPCNGAWGRRGCTNVHLASAEPAAVQVALKAAAAGEGANRQRLAPRGKTSR